MMATNYSFYDERQLAQAIDRLQGYERDMQIRLEARLQVRAVRITAPDSNLDPVAKRLGFLLLKAGNRRQAVEQELAMRQRVARITDARNTSSDSLQRHHRSSEKG